METPPIGSTEMIRQVTGRTTTDNVRDRRCGSVGSNLLELHKRRVAHGKGEMSSTIENQFTLLNSEGIRVRLKELKIDKPQDGSAFSHETKIITIN